MNLIIDGRRVDAASRSEVFNPATLEVVGTAPNADAGALDAAVAAGHLALGGEWAEEGNRREAMARFADAIDSEGEALARLLSLEQGKVLAAARVEVGIALTILRYYAAWQEGPQTLRHSAQERIFVERKAVGVAGLIVPWNYPLAILFMKLGPALRAGNSVVVKPAPSTPLTTLRLAEIASEILPAGVFNVLSGGNDLGQGITMHPGIAKVSFTGSTATGRSVMAASAPTLKRLTLELGGNDAAIVLADADVERAAQRLYASAFSNAGQVCAAVKRVYVHRSIHDELVAGLETIAARVSVSEGLSPQAQMGPIHSAMQRDFVTGLVATARVAGARGFDEGPSLPDLPGHFMRPTIVSGLGADAPLVVSEQFGPALPILPFDDPAEAVKAANASEFGLGASVWSADSSAALALARHLEAGSLYINSHALPPDPAVPFGGLKQSGLGHELGDWGIDEFSDRRVFRVEALPGEVL